MNASSDPLDFSVLPLTHLTAGDAGIILNYLSGVLMVFLSGTCGLSTLNGPVITKETMSLQTPKRENPIMSMMVLKSKQRPLMMSTVLKSPTICLETKTNKKLQSSKR